MLRSRVFLDNQDDIVFLFTTSSDASKVALSVVGLLSPRYDMNGNFMATVSFYGNDIMMMKHQAVTVMNMVSKVGKENRRNTFVLKISIHGSIRARQEISKFITEREETELLRKSELILAEFGMRENFGLDAQHDTFKTENVLTTKESKAFVSNVKTFSKM